MVHFHVLAQLEGLGLRLFRDLAETAPAEFAYDAIDIGVDERGLREFQANLDHQLHERVHAQLRDRASGRSERHEHVRTLPRASGYCFPDDLWLVEGANRVLVHDPFEHELDWARIHLASASRYRHGQLYLWIPGQDGRFLPASGMGEQGPYFDVPLNGRERHLFLFKFVNEHGAFEPDFANRLWTASDGPEVWVNSHSSSVHRAASRSRELSIHLCDHGAPGLPSLHLWQEDSDYVIDVEGEREARGCVRFETRLFTERRYEFLFKNTELSPIWEHDEARRNIFLRGASEIWTIDGDGNPRKLGDEGVWTLEGDHEVFGSRPEPSRILRLEVAARAPGCGIEQPETVDVWINRARFPLHRGLEPGSDGIFEIRTYDEVVTSFRFHAGPTSEQCERHFVKLSAADPAPALRYVVLGRADTLTRPPPRDSFEDPPFTIERPGVWLADGVLRIAVHCPTAASVELVGEWTNWQERPIPLRSTRDGSYFWGELSTSEILRSLGRTTLHGTHYKLLLNQVRLTQDPAADWVESSDPSAASRLVDHDQYEWQSEGWERPAWDSLIVYQLHPRRFARRGGLWGLDAVTRELREDDGYLRGVNASALLLMPTCEFAGDLGWGYNPSFFYAVESAYGGPDALKRLVDACHQHGRAVLLDVVFNHAGASDNALWGLAKESFFDGDTEWGAMINFDHPQALHFFERNLVHFMKNYRVDGFRFDFTRVIRYGGTWSDYVRVPGSGGGWEFMHRLRQAVHAVDPRCLFMAENLPNEWDLTRFGGPMDSQWCDAFHDRLVEAARGWSVLSELAEALCVTHTDTDQWYEATNYPESHDEVGNEPNRISHVAGIGQGYRRNKVAAAVTLLSRGIPMWFMGAEAGEWRQFSKDGDEPLDLTHYERDDSARRLRRWWNDLCHLRRGNPCVQGPAPLRVHYVDRALLVLSRGDRGDLFAVLNFGDWSGFRSLAEFHLPDGAYKERLNSTWGDYRIADEFEDEHANGGWDARLGRGSWIHVPDYGVVILERA